jgi:multiple sugar transport system substrate-binding protein
MRRRLSYFALLAVLTLGLCVLLATGCGSSSSTSSSPAASTTSTSHTPVTITLKHPWANPEKQDFTKAVQGFTAKYPWITLKLVALPTDSYDELLIPLIKTGNSPDAALSFGPDYVGQYASSDLWLDLKPYMDRDKVALSMFAPGTVSYTNYGGKQVALPSLTDAYGLYYNKDLFAKAGLTEPPKTMSQLMDYAKKLTVRNADGSIKVAGFVPLNSFEELGPSDLGRAFGAKWFDAQNNPQLSKDPGWAAALTWQKELVDWYGFANITKFFGTYAPTEFEASNAFQNGKVAMMWDGEWRTAFIRRYTPNLNYGTAPFPVADDKPELYGQGRVGGTIVGIPKGSPHPEEAWLLVKYLATDTDYLVTMANVVGNVPTTSASATSPNLKLPPQFQTFIDVWNNKLSSFAPPLQPSGAGYADIFNTFDAKWVSGKVTDLQAGLQKVDQDIANQLKMGAQAP